MTLSTQELIESIQSEIGESSAETANLLDHLTSAESCETLADLRQNLEFARDSAREILQNIEDQLCRLQDTGRDTYSYEGCTPAEIDDDADDCEKI